MEWSGVEWTPPRLGVVVSCVIFCQPIDFDLYQHSSLVLIQRGSAF